MAIDLMKYAVSDEQLYWMIEDEFKAACDEASRIKESLSKSKLEGKLEGKLEIAKNLLGLGMPVAQIAKATGLTEEQIAELMES